MLRRGFCDCVVFWLTCRPVRQDGIGRNQWRQHVDFAVLVRLFGSKSVMAQQFKNGQKDTDDLAAKVASFEEFAEGNSA